MFKGEKVTLKKIKENGGATITWGGFFTDLEYGYQVSVKDISIIPVYKLTARYLKELINTLSLNEYLGVWIEENKAYIDISTRINRKSEAIQLGKRNRQKSIFNWRTKEVIYL